MTTENDRNGEPYFYTGGNPYVCQFEQHSNCQVDGHSDLCRFIAREAEMIREAQAQAWAEGHAAGQDYAGDGGCDRPGCAHDPRDDNPYLSIPPDPAHVRVSNGEDALDTCSGCGWESWDTYPTFEEHVIPSGPTSGEANR